MFCDNCGHSYHNTKFCGNCGSPVGIKRLLSTGTPSSEGPLKFNEYLEKLESQQRKDETFGSIQKQKSSERISSCIKKPKKDETVQVLNLMSTGLCVINLQNTFYEPKRIQNVKCLAISNA